MRYVSYACLLILFASSPIVVTVSGESSARERAPASPPAAQGMLKDSGGFSGSAPDGQTPRHRAEVVVQKDHVSAVLHLTFSRDGRRLYAGYSNHKIVYWDLRTGTPVRTFRGHTKETQCVAFSPDGRYVATGLAETRAQTWEAASGRRLRTLNIGPYSLSAVAFSPDGNSVLTGGGRSHGLVPETGKVPQSGRAILWDAASGRKLQTFVLGEGLIQTVAFSPDGRQVACAGGRLKLDATSDAKVAVWHRATGRQLHQWQWENDMVNAVAFSPDGRHLLVGSFEETTLWDASTGKRLHSFRGLDGFTETVAFSPDGRKVLAGGGHLLTSMPETIITIAAPGEAVVWEKSTRKQLHTLRGHHFQVRTASFSPDGKVIATGCYRGEIRIWDVATGREVARLLAVGKGDAYVAATPEGYFDASPGIQKLLHWRVGERAFPFERYEKKYHRPELVTRALRGLIVEEKARDHHDRMTPK